ncbi:MAG: OprD family porin, partial [Pseudomonadales bacterium]|nr:OprD family porin [Pseudomonadales bacterium]
MFIKPTLISTALLAAASMQVQAAESSNGFFADSKLDLGIRTYYFNRDKIGEPDSKALSQALRLDFTSGYLNDIVGFDASIFSTQKLSGELGHGGTGLLRDDGCSQRVYAK